MSTYRSRAAEQRIVEDVSAGQDLMCSAHGCQHRWSVDAGSGKLCSWHAWSEPHRWPQITQERLDAMAARAHREQYREPSQPKVMTKAEKVQTLRSLRDAVAPTPGRKDWAQRIVSRAKDGERVSPLVLRIAQTVVSRKAKEAA